MNLYRAVLRVDGREYRFDVEASTHGTAIRRALYRTADSAISVSVSCTLMARNIVREPWISGQGRVLSPGAR